MALSQAPITPFQVSNINQPITPQEFPEIKSKIRFPGNEVPIIVTPENVEKVQLPVYSTILKPVPKKNLTPTTTIKSEPKLIQAFNPQQAALSSIKDIDPEMVSGESSRKGAPAYSQKQLQEIAKKLGLKTSGVKAVLAQRIRDELKRIGMIEK